MMHRKVTGAPLFNALCNSGLPVDLKDVRKTMATHRCKKR